MMGLKMLMNPKLALAFVLAIGFAGGLGYTKGAKSMKNSIAADIAREEQLAQRIYDQTILATASEISKIEITNTTIRQEVEREIRTEKIYLECRHTGATKRLLDAVLTGERSAESIDRSELSVINATGG